jgi:hypothetical protein
MAAVWYRLRAELRSRWRAWVGLALLVGIAGGVSLALVAGARRTDSAYTRLLAAERPYDVAVFEGGFAGDLDVPDFLDRVAAMPEVAESARFRSLFDNGGQTGDGRRIGEPDYLQTIVAEDEQAAAVLARQKLLEGRHPDPDVAGEVAVNFTVAERYDLAPGDALELELFTETQASPYFATGVPTVLPIRGERFRFEVIGVFASAGDFPPRSLGDGAGTVNLTPAFYEAHPEYAPMQALAVRLHHGTASAPSFKQGVERIAGGAFVPFDAFGNLTARSIQHRATDRSIHLLAVALWVLAALAVTAALLVVGQALLRSARLGTADDGTLRALGCSDEQLTIVRTLLGAFVALGGGVLAAGLAIALSPVFPLGLARTAEPDPGVRVDAIAVLGGAIVVVAVTAALGAFAAWRATRTSRASARVRVGAVGLSTALGRSPLPVPAATGVRMALQGGRGATMLPARSTIAGAVIAVAALVGAVTFGAGLARLLDTPRLFGWNWDATVGDGYGMDAYDEVVPALRANPTVDAVAAGTFGAVEVEGRELMVLATDPVEGSIAATVVNGRAPAAPDEIVVGRTTMGESGISIGERVRVRYLGTFNGEAAEEAPVRRLRVVGEAVLPEQSDIGLDDAGAMTYEGLLALTSGDERPARNFFPVRFVDGVDPERAFARLTRSVDLYTVPTQRPTDLVNFGRVDALPILGAGMVTLIAVAMLVHLLLSSVRRRRRELALLKTLGFTTRQVSSAVAWQASTLVVLALVVGVPLGVAAGRWAWSLTAEELGVVVQPVVPIVALLLLVPLALVVANVVAWVPAWIAGRTRPAVVLRAE